MEFPFTLDGFSKRRLSVTLPGAFRGPVLTVDGVDRPPAKGSRYDVVDDIDRSRQIVLKGALFDAVPMVQVDTDKPRAIVPKLAWYELVWVALPFGLIGIGGALGGGLGFLGLSLNTRIFRTQQGPARYGLTALVTLLTFVIYFVVATLIRSAIGTPG